VRVSWRKASRESNRIVIIREAEPMPPRRTKSRFLLSGTCLLRSNEYEETYSFIDLGDRGRDADVKRSAGIAQPGHSNATNLET
jgi:hypothetical protein